VRLANPVVPRFLATAVGVGSAAVRNADDSVRNSAFDDESDLYADLSGALDSIIAASIEPSALTRKSCAPNAAAWTNDACLITSTFAKTAAGQRSWSPSIDNLLRHSLNTDAIGAIVTVGNGFWTADAISAIQPNLAPAIIQSARRTSRAEETGTDEATKPTKGG